MKLQQRSRMRLRRTLNILKKCSVGIALGGVLLVCVPPAAHAQTVITPVSANHYYIELKDVSLSDALELIFKTAGNPSHQIAPEAKHYYITSLTMTNVKRYDAVMQLVNSKGFKLTRPNGKEYVIKAPPGAKKPQGGPGAGAAPGMPPNPFGASLQMGASVGTVANAQFNRNSNRNRGRNGNRSDPNSPPYGIDNGTYQLLLVNHVYSGGIARLFDVGDIVPTEEFVYPESSGNSGGGGGFGGGGGLGGLGGGGISGIGGNSNNRNSGFGGSGGGGFGGGGFGGGGGGIGGFSDRNLKENFAAVDSNNILDKVSKLPISTWNYKFDDTAVRHLGPMAQDFAKAFGVGRDDRHIFSIDEGGVSLAAIQALYKLVQKQSKEIEDLKTQVEQLKTHSVTATDGTSTSTVKLPAAP